MLVGITPFFTNRKEDIFHNIEFGELKIPEFVSEKAATLLGDYYKKTQIKDLGEVLKMLKKLKNIHILKM